MDKVRASPPPTPTLHTQNLPPPTPNNWSTKQTATAKRCKYLRRIFKFKHMDFEFAMWQMMHLMVAPQKVYRNFQYRKQTRDQFARDDPAFLVLMAFWLCASSVAFALVLHLHFVGFLKFLLWVVFIDCIGVGICVATLFWFLANKYLRKPTCMDQDVEWGYAFDVHLNAFFPLLIVLHVIQIILFPVFIGHEWFMSYFVGNTLWLFAVSYYIYITFLGYSALPILKRTEVILYPITFFAIFYIVTLAIGLNLSRGMMNFYMYRVL